jgi:hypothetical protein
MRGQRDFYALSVGRKRLAATHILPKRAILSDALLDGAGWPLGRARDEILTDILGIEDGRL